VPGGTAAFAQAFGIDPTPDRSRYVYEIIRLLYNAPEGRRPVAEAYLQSLRQSLTRTGSVRTFADRDNRNAGRGDSATEVVPIPLTVDLWSSAIFRRKVAPREIVTAIVADRNAALICLALSTVDDQTLQYFVDHPSLLERINERSALAFGAFGGTLQIRNNRVVFPSAGIGRVTGSRRRVAAVGSGRAGTADASRPVHHPAGRAERRARRLRVRRDRAARSAAPRVRARPVDPEPVGAGRSIQGADLVDGRVP